MKHFKDFSKNRPTTAHVRTKNQQKVVANHEISMKQSEFQKSVKTLQADKISLKKSPEVKNVPDLLPKAMPPKLKMIQSSADLTRK